MAIQWIPVSERLPGSQELIMVSFDNGSVDIIWQDWVEGEKMTYQNWDEDCFEHPQVTALAWAPIPEPYRPQTEEGSHAV